MSRTLWVGCPETGRPLSGARLSWHAGAGDLSRFGLEGWRTPAYAVARALFRIPPGDRRADDLRALVAEAIRLGGMICHDG